MQGENPEYADEVIKKVLEHWDEVVGRTEESQNDEQNLQDTDLKQIILLLQPRCLREHESGREGSQDVHHVPESCSLSQWIMIRIYPGVPGTHKMPCYHLLDSMCSNFENDAREMID